MTKHTRSIHGITPDIVKTVFDAAFAVAYAHQYVLQAPPDDLPRLKRELNGKLDALSDACIKMQDAHDG